jgi:multidrug resistance efflux pump
MLCRPNAVAGLAPRWPLVMVGMAVAALAPAVHAETPAPRSAQTSPAGKPLQLGIAISGIIEKIMVSDGDHVEAGQLLLRLDCRVAEARAEARSADLAAAEAALLRTRNGPRPDEIAIGEAGVGVAQARAEEAADALKRLMGLTEGVSVTRVQIFLAEREARVTAAQLEDSRKKLALLRAGSRSEDIAEAEARREASAAEASEAKAEADQCSLKAPIAGVVRIVATLGQFVSVTAPVTLVQLTPDKPSP